MHPLPCLLGDLVTTKINIPVFNELVITFEIVVLKRDQVFAPLTVSYYLQSGFSAATTQQHGLQSVGNLVFM